MLRTKTDRYCPLGCSLGWWVAAQLLRTCTEDLFFISPHYSLLTPLFPPLLISHSVSGPHCHTKETWEHKSEKMRLCMKSRTVKDEQTNTCVLHAELNGQIVSGQMMKDTGLLRCQNFPVGCSCA